MMIGYLDMPSGISGDMLLGCLVSAGWDLADLRQTLASLSLPVDEWSIDARPVMKGPLSAMQVCVTAAEGHHHRRLSDVSRIIASGKLSDSARRRALAIFTRLAQAEAKVHGTTVEQVHFHEVGAVDALIDVVGCVAGIEALGVERLFASPLPLSPGWVTTAHGPIPLPAPATLELLAQVRAPTRPGPGEGEWVTPTGAAILAELATFGQPPMRLERLATGAGRRACPWPNAARLWLGTLDETCSPSLVTLETNLDDMNPQWYEPVVGNLLGAGALDTWLTPVHMKKGRPGTVLSVLARAPDAPALADMILRQTTTLGVRVLPVQERIEAQRQVCQVATPYGTVRVKVKYLDGRPASAAPEHDDCLRLAGQAGVPLPQVHAQAAAAAQRLLAGEPKPA